MLVRRIAIVTVMLALFVLCIYLVISAFSDPELAKPNIAENHELPIVPNDPVQDKNISKSEQLEQRKNEITRRQLEEANQSEVIDLNIFNFDEDEEVLNTPPVEEEQNKTQTKAVSTPVQTQPKKRSVSRKKKDEQELDLLENEKNIDPALEFFTSESNETPVVEEESKIEIYAVVHDQKEYRVGERLTLRTTRQFVFKDKVLPKNSFIYTTVRFGNNRVELVLPSIPFSDGSLLPKRLIAKDGNDYEIGLYAPQLMESEVANQTAEDLINEAESRTNSSIVRDLLGGFGKRKLRDNAIPVKSNHPVILTEQ